MDTLIILCAKYLIYVVALVGVLVAWRGARFRGLVLLVACVVLAEAVGKAAGLLWYDPLPFVQGNFTPLIPHAANNGFPSDHTLIAAAVGACVIFWNRWWGTLLFVLAVIVGASRVAAGVHHPIDVAAALVIAAVCAVVVQSLARRFTPAPAAPQEPVQ